jgi:hypothetical protein
LWAFTLICERERPLLAIMNDFSARVDLDLGWAESNVTLLSLAGVNDAPIDVKR